MFEISGKIGAPGEVEVTMSIDIKVGKFYHMTSSYAYAGVEPGVVKVIGVVSPDDLTSPDIDEIVKRDIETFKEIELNMSSDNMSCHEDVEAYNASKEFYNTTLWVVYCYPYSNCPVCTYVFPLEHFASHITRWL